MLSFQWVIFSLSFNNSISYYRNEASAEICGYQVMVSVIIAELYCVGGIWDILRR
jgi:hypothetical protein